MLRLKLQSQFGGKQLQFRRPRGCRLARNEVGSWPALGVSDGNPGFSSCQVRPKQREPTEKKVGEHVAKGSLLVSSETIATLGGSNSGGFPTKGTHGGSAPPGPSATLPLQPLRVGGAAGGLAQFEVGRCTQTCLKWVCVF